MGGGRPLRYNRPMLPYDASLAALMRPESGPPPLLGGAQRAPDDRALGAEAARLAYWRAEKDPAAAALLQAAFGAEGFGHFAAFHDPHTDSQGFAVLRESDGLALLGLRGSQPHIREWRQNVKFRLIEARDGRWPGKVHTGFAEDALGLLPQVQAWLQQHAAARQRLLLAGHSLGAALALLLPAMIQPACPMRVLAFGAPRIGDAAFVHAMAQKPGLAIERIVHVADAICDLPPPALGYSHGGDRVYIDRDGQLKPGASDGDIAADRWRAHLDYTLRHAWRPGNVPTRALADHTPINYVRAFWP